MPHSRQPRLTPKAAEQELATLVAPAARTFGDAFAIVRLEKPQIMGESLGYEVRQVIAAGLGAPE